MPAKKLGPGRPSRSPNRTLNLSIELIRALDKEV
jgi:hypothetical protein